MKITVFCGANNGRNEEYKENAKELGKWIPEERIFRWNPAGSSGIPNSKENGKEAEIDFRGAFS